MFRKKPHFCGMQGYASLGYLYPSELVFKAPGSRIQGCCMQISFNFDFSYNRNLKLPRFYGGIPVPGNKKLLFAAIILGNGKSKQHYWKCCSCWIPKGRFFCGTETWAKNSICFQPCLWSAELPRNSFVTFFLSMMDDSACRLALQMR